MRMSQFFIFIFAYLVLVGFTPMNGINTQSLEWQKIELERTIKSEVHSTISPIIRSGEFIVNVSVKIKPIPSLKDASSGGAGGGKDDKNKKSTVKFSDIDPKDAKDEYIVLSKLGLEAPVYQDEDKDPVTGQGKSEAQQWQKFISDYLQNYDLFKTIEAVNIDVKLDEYLGDETKKTVEELINGMNLEFGSVKVKVQTSYISMKEMKKELNKKVNNDYADLYKWLGQMGLPFAVILAVLLFCTFAFVLFKKYAALQEKQMEMMREQMTQQKPESKDEKKKDEAEEVRDGVISGGSEDKGKEDGIERFQAMISTNPVEASLMVKRWISDQSKIHQMVLNVLVKELSGDELSKIFTNISLEERRIWKQSIGKAMKPDDIRSAKRYVGTQVVQELIIPNSITDAETVDLLIRIKPEDTARFCEEQPHLGAILMNVMNAKFLSKMMDQLTDEVTQSLLQESFQLNPLKIQSLLPDFKSKLKAHVKTEHVSPFMEKLGELIPLSSPQRERALYEGYAQGVSPEKLLTLAQKHFPSELIFKVPDAMMKSFVQTYPRERRAELVMILNESVKEKFIAIIAPNEKSRDMLNLDIEKLENNPLQKKRIENTRDMMLKDFFDHCRKQIKTNPSFLKELEPVLKNWLVSLNGQSVASPTSIQAA